MKTRSRGSNYYTNLSAMASRNVRSARRNWVLSREQVGTLRSLTAELRLSVTRGDLRLLNGAWYVTHAGLMRLAHRSRCAGIRVRLIPEFCDASASRWVFEAVVYKSKRSKAFTGYGDADPSTISSLVRGAEMRVAETRAVNRALRKAYGIGLCSVEELGWAPKPYGPSDPQKGASASHTNGHQNGNPRLRDRLCLLIRQHQLDANLVKAYAADSCGTPNLREATREQIENFVTNLADWATKDRPALLCKLNSYSRSQEVSS
jgi:hypothetical protein